MTLDEYLQRNDLSEREFARRIGVTQQAVNRYRNKMRLPERVVMERITEATGGAVQPNDFFAAGLPDGVDEEVTQLGREVPIPASPDEAVLETVKNPKAGTRYLARFTCPEFTCLCPVTGQPDFAQFVIDYVPEARLIESKSLKLFLASFRNHRAFHEDCTVTIAERLQQAAKPHWLRIGGYWYPRGGIPIDVFYQSGPPPEGLWIPDPGIAPYRGRG
jgi:7-cyano-7-deazaguanine reductase